MDLNMIKNGCECHFLQKSISIPCFNSHSFRWRTPKAFSKARSREAAFEASQAGQLFLAPRQMLHVDDQDTIILVFTYYIII